MTNAINHILVVDDDRRLRDLLGKFLDDHSYRTSLAANAAEARSHLACQQIDVIILDVMMPGESGIELTQSLRKSNNVPILMLTARDQLDDKIRALDLGADDYMTKPFEPLELLARIKSLLRRAQDKAAQPNVLNFGKCSLDIQKSMLFCENKPVYLTSTELILLKTLAQKPNQPFSREDLAQRIGHRVSERTVDVQITRLRRKVGDDPRQPRTIQTVRHIGYALCPD